MIFLNQISTGTGTNPVIKYRSLYNFSNQPWKTQRIVAKILEEEYGVGPGGLSGNEDAGQMSAWYVFGSLGFYPVCPASDEFQISGPRFNKITITLGSGKKLIISAPCYSKDNYFISKMRFNGTEHKEFSISNKLLNKGGEWNFTLISSPYKED
jgi:putative alpha-1,2-mannosidase